MDEDAPCTGEPPSLAIVYIASPDGLFVMPVVVIDFYHATLSQPRT